MLGVTLARETQIEHHAVAALKQAARAGDCEATRTPQVPSPPSTVQNAVTAAAPPVAPTTSVPASSRSRVHRKPAKPRHVKPRHAVKAASARIPLPLPGPSSGSGSALVVVLALVGAVMVLVVTVVRRGVLRPVAAGMRLPNWQLSALSYQRHETAALLPTPPNASEAEVNAYERLYEFEDPAGASDLGVALANKGDLAGALAAFRRADECGDAAGASNLGVMLAERGDAAGALAAFRRADERGDAEGASNLGVLLERQGDLEAALAAYRRADQRGDAEGALNLGSLLAERGDVPGAIDAYRRARRRGDPELAEAARQALQKLTGS
jgi:Flp pilus assembly protein TadD